MKTIVAPTTANSMLIHGIFYDGKNFVDKYKNILEDTWVVSCYWTNQNSKFGCEIADIKTTKFCQDYGLKNIDW